MCLTSTHTTLISTIFERSGQRSILQRSRGLRLSAALFSLGNHDHDQRH